MSTEHSEIDVEHDDSAIDSAVDSLSRIAKKYDVQIIVTVNPFSSSIEGETGRDPNDQ